MLKRFAPATVVVTDRGDIIFIHGRTGAYLEPSPGEPRNNVLDMAREGLQIEISAAMRECAKTGADVNREAIRVRTNGAFAYVKLTVAKIKEPESIRGLLLITFRPSATAAPISVRPKKKGKKENEDQRFAALERELQHTKESQQTTLEELETSNEELKSANEELQSIARLLHSRYGYHGAETGRARTARKRRAPARDITSRKETEAKLELYRKNLQVASSELMLAEERERRRLAEDLHDNLGQAVFRAIMTLDHR